MTNIQKQETFVVERFSRLEIELDKRVRKPYEASSQVIIKTLEKVFAMYEHTPLSVRYLLIEQELDRLKVFQQIRLHYGQLGEDFVDFLKGWLEHNFKKAVTHTNEMLENEEDVIPFYVEQSNVLGWKLESVSQGTVMVDLILLLLSKKKSVEAISKEIKDLSSGQAYKAKRLARTETAVLLNDVSLKIMTLSGVKKVKWTDATENLLFRNKYKKRITRVCPVCRGYATGGKNGDGVYPIGKLPAQCPAHPNCRCTLVPII